MTAQTTLAHTTEPTRSASLANTVQPFPGGPYTRSGMAMANALIVLGERVGKASAGPTVDVLLLERRG